MMRPEKIPLAVEPPCQTACPLGTDARGYVILTSARHFEDAYLVATAENALPATCGRACSAQCESVCTRNELDKPIAIRRIKRFLADKFKDSPPPRRSKLPVTGRSVAIIGGGPAGLSAARELAGFGHEVTIFDAATTLGGMAALGVPRFRLPLEELKRDVSRILELGVKIVPNTRVGRDLAFADVRSTFDAVFVAAGALEPNELKIPGASLPGVLQALPWLEQANLTGQADCGETVVVIGGGYTAMDAARTALRLGASQVSIVYRRGRQEMEVDNEEVEGAKEEGVALHLLASPIRFCSSQGQRVSGVKFIRNRLGQTDESGRRRPIPIPGSEFIVKADTVILALGQEPELSFLEGQLEIERSLPKVDLETLQTSLPGVFAGGDFVRGPSTIVEAIADGRLAARSIHRYLSFPLEWDDTSAPALCDISPDHLYEGVWLSRKPPDLLKADAAHRKKQFHMEVEPTISEETAVTEALRCLYCGLEPLVMPEECSLCAACLSICPESCIGLVAEFGEDGRPAVWTNSPTEAIAFGIDHERCIRCGQCARVCSTEAIRFPALNGN